ncbi:hypothetical protein MUK42_31459, partial [Musa troglodytarum]
MAAPTGSIRASSSKISRFSFQVVRELSKETCGLGVFNQLKSFEHSPVLQSVIVAVQVIKETGDRFREIILTLGDGTSPSENPNANPDRIVGGKGRRIRSYMGSTSIDDQWTDCSGSDGKLRCAIESFCDTDPTLLGWASRRLLLIYVALSRSARGRGWCSLDLDSDATALTKSLLIESIHRSLTFPLRFAGWDGLCAVKIYDSYLL